MRFQEIRPSLRRSIRSYGDQPETSSGSPTYPLDMVAALTEDRKFLTIAVVNGTDTEHKFDLKATGVSLSGPSTLWQMTGSSLDAENHVGQPTQVAVKEIAVDDAAGTFAVAPFSVSIYRFPMAAAGN